MAVTVEKDIKSRQFGDPLAFPVANSETIYGGTLAVVDKTGYLYNLDSDAIYTARIPVLVADGSANEDGPGATTSAGSISGTYQEKSAVAGDKTVRKCYVFAEVELTFTSIAQSDVGKTVYATDNFTVDEAQAGGLKIGTLVKYISATKGWVLLNTYFNADGTIVARGNITATTTSTGGAAISWANPMGETILVEDFVIDVTTEATGAATMDIGVAADGTTSSDTLIDGIDVGSAAILASAIDADDQGTNGKAHRKLSSTQYITGTASASLAGIVGTYMAKFRIWE